MIPSSEIAKEAVLTNILGSESAREAVNLIITRSNFAEANSGAKICRRIQVQVSPFRRSTNCYLINLNPRYERNVLSG